MQEIKQLIIVNRTYGVVSQTFSSGRFPTLTFINGSETVAPTFFNGSETVAPTKDLEVYADSLFETILTSRFSLSTLYPDVYRWLYTFEAIP